MRQNKIDTIQNNFIKYHSHILSDLQHSVHVRGTTEGGEKHYTKLSVLVYTHSKNNVSSC